MGKKRMSVSTESPITSAQLDQLRIAAGKGPILITTHDNPDPDALAAGLALSRLLANAWNIASQLVYCGKVGRAENQTILRLITPEWAFQETLSHLEQFRSVALVDSQPGAGNHSLPAGLIPVLVFDHHHPIRPESSLVPYVDIRYDIGATVTMLYQYLVAAQVPIDQRLATAMFLGIKTDTDGLSRNAGTADAAAYSLLHAAVDQQLLTQVQLSGLSIEYFEAFNHGLHHAWIVGQAITTFLGKIHRPDLVAEMADLLLRLEDVHTALCMGCYDNTLYFSLRTGLSGLDAGLLIQQIVPPEGKAGGHGTMAGGQVPLNPSREHETIDMVRSRFLQALGEKGPGRPLLKIAQDQQILRPSPQ